MARLVFATLPFVLASLFIESRLAYACRDQSKSSSRTVSALALDSNDSTPPAMIQSAWIEDVVRDDTNDTRGDACAGQSGCTPIGTIVIGLVAPTDDTTPSDQIGYIVSVEPRLAGRAPSPAVVRYLPPGTDLVLLSEDGRLLFDFNEPKNEVVALDFDLLIVPVDLAGNKGEAFRLHVKDSDAMGCQASRRPSGLLPVWILAIAILAIRVRQRAWRP